MMNLLNRYRIPVSHYPIKNSVFRRLTILFLLIEGVILIGVSALLYRYVEMQDTYENNTLRENVSSGIEQIDEQIKSAYQMTQNIVSDTRLAQIAYHMYPDQYEKSKLVLGVLSSIRNIQNLNPVVEDIKITFPRESLDLSVSNQYNKWSEYQLPSESEKTLMDFLFIEDGILKIRITYPLGSQLLGELPDYECEVTLSQNFLISFLSSFHSNEQTGALLLLNSKDMKVIPVSEPEMDFLGEQITKNIEQNGTIPFGNIQVNGEDYRVFSQTSNEYPVTLLTYRNTTYLNKKIFTTLIQIFCVILLSGFFFLIIIWQTNNRVVVPIYRLMEAFDKIKERKLSTRIFHDRKDEFHFIYDAFNEMVQHMEQLIADIREQHTLLQNAELMQLQAQIDPHFLYNSFNIIKYMADGEEYDQITEFVSALARYYRFINKEIRQSIPLSVEVEHMRTYVYIQQMRFADRIRVEIDQLPPQAAQFPVPKLILQPLVENCYNHGLKNKLDDGIITVSFTLSGTVLSVCVADNGEEMTTEKLLQLQQQVTKTDDASVSHALANIRRRLELAYGSDNMLQLSLGDAGGLQIKLLFDLQKKPLEFT